MEEAAMRTSDGSQQSIDKQALETIDKQALEIAENSFEYYRRKAKEPDSGIICRSRSTLQ
jgi:predicted transcriptional regulator